MAYMWLEGDLNKAEGYFKAILRLEIYKTLYD